MELSELKVNTNKVFVIAEVGVNHNGSMRLAKKLVDIACDAGADCVKFQTYKTEELVLFHAPMADYQLRNTKKMCSQYHMLKNYELPYHYFEELLSYCNKRGIVFLSSPFDHKSADFLESLGVEAFKIPSGELNNKPLIEHIARKRGSIILSTGASYLKEIQKTTQWIENVWQVLKKQNDLYLLQCTSCYPTPYHDVHLRVLTTLQKKFPYTVGLSDHSKGWHIPLAAVGFGARIIEKHLTVDRSLPGPDHRASLTSLELKKMVQAIRHIEMALGSFEKKPTGSEENVRNLVRKSIVSNVAIKKGDEILPDMVALKRPSGGLDPELMDQIINKKAKRYIKRNTTLQYEDIF